MHDVTNVEKILAASILISLCTNSLRVPRTREPNGNRTVVSQESDLPYECGSVAVVTSSRIKLCPLGGWKMGAEPALHEGTALLKERLSVLDVEVSLVDDDMAERALACGVAAFPWFPREHVVSPPRVHLGAHVIWVGKPRLRHRCVVCEKTRRCVARLPRVSFRPECLRAFLWVSVVLPHAGLSGEISFARDEAVPALSC